MLEHKVILKVAYDGTQFHGWQTQKSIRTVQQVMAKAWHALTGKFEYPQGSGRTDAGVHANAQIASFNMPDMSIPAPQYAAALNRYLPQDVRILQSAFGPKEFDPRRCAVSRTYFYDFGLALPGALPQMRNRVTLFKQRTLLLSRLNTLSGLFLGTHNFGAFSSVHDQNKNKVRTVYTSCIIPLWNGCLRYEICANAFLMNMVRAIMGSLLHFHDDPHGQEKILTALEGGKKERLGATAPPQGLTLVQVQYPPVYTFLR
ncbi:MAG: tRNA pseudouridine(38-40) synthase TruA [Spirochaetia bacterium]